MGAKGDGLARQEAEAHLAQGPPVDRVQVVAVLRQNPTPGDMIDCSGTVISASGVSDIVKLKPACLTLAQPRR